MSLPGSHDTDGDVADETRHESVQEIVDILDMDDDTILVACVVALRELRRWKRAGAHEALDVIDTALAGDRQAWLNRAVNATTQSMGGNAPPDVNTVLTWLTDQRPLGIKTAGEHAADLNQKRPFLFSPIWPAGDYGTVLGPFNAGKTMALLDAAVSAASGTPWLGQFPVGTPGPVLMFLAEGGIHEATRRGRAIAASRGLKWDDLPISLSMDVPQFDRPDDLDKLRLELLLRPATLVIIDPLYVATPNAPTALLHDMGALLRPVQRICQQADATLVIGHHTNRAGGATGAGPAEWARVSVTITAKPRATKGQGTDVQLDVTTTGNGVGTANYRLRRRVWADDPHDLNSPLNYRIDVPGRPSPAEPLASDEAVMNVARLLDELAVPLDASVRNALQKLRDAGQGKRSEIVGSALAFRANAASET